MKIRQATRRVAALMIVLVAIASTAACHSTKMGQHVEWEGKILRADVRQQYINSRSNSLIHRMAYVRNQYGSGLSGGTRLFSVLIPDNIEYDDLETGAIVEVIFEPGDSDYDIWKGHWSRIVRLICKGSDKECRNREWASGRMTQVIDEHPGDDMKRFGNTYDRHITEADIKKYIRP
jgi:hypothetical protein